ncbi:MAG: SRPBCC family protein [Gemmatimonadaceae bacterium]
MPVSRVANSETFHVSTPSDCEIRITRLFSAPRALVFEVFTNPELVKNWWGGNCDGYVMVACEGDVRVGGKWRYANRTPTGFLAAFNGVYSEVTPPERLVFTEIFEMFPDSPSTVTVEFAEEKGKTRMTLMSVYPSVQVRDMVLQSGMEKGAALSYDRLEEIAETFGKK